MTSQHGSVDNPNIVQTVDGYNIAQTAIDTNTGRTTTQPMWTLYLTIIKP